MRNSLHKKSGSGIFTKYIGLCDFFNRPRCKSVEKQDVIGWESHGSLKNLSSLNMDLYLVDLLHVTLVTHIRSV